MGFNQDFQELDEKYNILDTFLSYTGLEQKKILLEGCLDYIGDEAHESNYTHHLFVKIDYPEIIDYIKTFEIEKFGIFEFAYRDGYSLESIEDYEKYRQEEYSVLTNEVNRSVFKIGDYEADDIKKEFYFNFSQKGERVDMEIANEAGFYIVINYFQPKRDNPYYINLMIRGNELIEKKLYDLSFLVLFSAIDNFITLKLEELQSDYHNEIDLEKLEFTKKISLLVKTWTGLLTDKPSNDVRDLIIKDYKDLYEYRNQVAHGKENSITLSDCTQCWSLFIKLYFIEKHKVNNIAALIKALRVFLKTK